MRIFISASALAQIESLAPLLHKRITRKLRFFANQTDPLLFAKPVTNTPYFRFRIGDYRVLFELIGGSIHIAKIERRDKAYD